MLKRLREIIHNRLNEEPLYIRKKILGEIGGMVQTLSNGRAYFPAKQISVQIYAESEEQRLDYESYFVEEKDLVTRIRERIASEGADDDAAGVEVVVRITLDMTADRDAEKHKITCRQARSWSRAFLAILRGSAAETEYELKKSRTAIGRSEEPQDEAGMPVRRNDVVFLDIEDEINSSVSRIHSSIEFDVTLREFRIYDDDSGNDTRIVRNGESFKVSGPRGEVLKNGDLIYFGKAAARFTCVSGEE